MSGILGGLRPVRPRDWSMRGRLIASLLGLLVVVCLGIGLLTEVVLKHTLIARIDSQLAQTADRMPTGRPQFDGPTFGGRQLLLPPGSPLDAIGAEVSGGVVITSRFQDPDNAYPALSAQAQSALLKVPPDGTPRSVDLPGLGPYRVIARSMPGGDTWVSGLSLKSVNSTLTQVSLAVTGLSVLGLVVAAIMMAWIVRLALRPLRRVTATASRVAEMSLDSGEVALAERVPESNPSTEVGQVGVALNRMLENVNDALNARHRSETRVRQFVADASHELRTPLAAIRGYAELTRRSRHTAPPDIAHAMGRVESEAGRMTELVEDLLLLARLDAGRPLESDDVDLTRLAVDTISDAHAAGPDHRWRLDVGDDPVQVRGDAARLHQVLANLLANARSHTPSGTTVEISLTRSDGWATLRVRDNGPGIPAELMPEIFERFARGEQSRSRGKGSTGLGLAIVAAVVAAHHGDIEATSEPGDTIFTVRLPMQPSQSARSLQGDRQARAQTLARSADKGL